MTITLFGTASNPVDNGSANEPVTLDVTPPASMLTGDLAVIIGNERIGTSGAMTQSALGGQTWTAIRTGANSGANSTNIAAWFCEFNGTWSANPSIAYASSAGTVSTTTIMLVFRGATGWAVDVAAVGVTSFAAATTITRTGLTTTHNEALAIAMFTSGAASTWGSISGAGWQQAGSQWRNTAGSALSFAATYQYVPTSGTATGNVSLTQSTSTAGIDLIASVFGTPAATTRPVKMASYWGGFAGESGGFAG